MTSCDVIFTIYFQKLPKGVDKMLMSAKRNQIGSGIFHLSERTLYYLQIEGSTIFLPYVVEFCIAFGAKIRIFGGFLLTSLKSCWRQPNFCWPSKWSVYFWKVVGLDYFHTENHVYSAICSNFRVGVQFYPPFLILTHIKSSMSNMVTRKMHWLQKSNFLDIKLSMSSHHHHRFSYTVGCHLVRI